MVQGAWKEYHVDCAPPGGSRVMLPKNKGQASRIIFLSTCVLPAVKYFSLF